MDEKQKRTRGKSVLLRLTEEEFSKFENSVSKSGMSKQEFLRRNALQKKIIVIAGLPEFVFQLKKIGNNFNQLVRNSNEGYLVDCNELKQIGKELDGIWQSLKQLKAMDR